jgi:hypothetical protein
MRLISFRQERTDFLANSLHLAAMHAMSQLLSSSINCAWSSKGGRRERVYKVVLPIHDDKRLSVYGSGSTL